MSRLIVGTCWIIAFLMVPVDVHASKTSGLRMTPVREYVNLAAGQVQQKSVVVANDTDKSMTIRLSVGQFSVLDYSYEYTFKDATKDWIKIAADYVELAPNKSQMVNYAISLPQAAAPGGYYFTIFASVDNSKNAMRVAETIYLDISGDSKKSSLIQNGKLPLVNFNNQIEYFYDVKSTGNTHFFIYADEMVDGWGAMRPTVSETHILLPETVRRIRRVFRAPILPGVYKINYGYKTDDGASNYKQGYIINLPFWSVLIALASIYAVYLFAYRASCFIRTSSKSRF